MDNPISYGRTRRHIEENEIDILQFFNEWFRSTMIAVVLRFRILGLNFLRSLKVMIGKCYLVILSLAVKQLMNCSYRKFWFQRPEHKI